MKQDKKNISKVGFASLLIALGIVYGDISTSPLYTFKAIIGTKEINEMLVLGGLSCIFWTLTLQTSLKYVWLTLKADNEGEGGIFSLYSLVRRYGKKIIIPTMVGAAALLADGIITPAVTVTSAIEGLKMIKGLENISVAPIVIFIISVIFFSQRFGSQKIGKAFGPIMFIWLTILLIFGLTQVIHFPSVIKALNPYYAYNLLVHYPQGFWILGAVFLCTTGAEALYSDLGHCGKENIRISWIYVKSCLVINYLGQGAWVLNENITVLDGKNPFFEMMPYWFLLPGIIIATLAAIVASQSLISGSFTLISEAINLNFWQRVNIKQPTEIKGQVYIPSVNLLLWVGCIFVVLYFQTSTRMEAAYGLAITITMMTTTFLLSYFLTYKLKWNKFFILLLFVSFSVIEISFFISNVMKFTHGGYITIFLGGVFFFVMYISYFGRKINDRYTKYVDLVKYSEKITELSNDNSVSKFVTHLIYLTKSERRDQIEEKIIQSIFAKKPKRAEVYWFFHINRTNSPYTLNYDVNELVDDKIIKITVNIGFRIRPRTELYFTRIIQDLISNQELNLHLKNHGTTKYNPGIDYKFIITEKFLSVENEFSLRDGLVLKTYFLLKRFGQKDTDAFGLDKSVVVMEQIPLVYQPIKSINLVRINGKNK
ncbi:KUP/HAK/KT family potassium transporter [Avrilella dinanensis]|uniref:Probable potassium transport system protein Kup n=1 Tax=Avrilella dinanensis TaxID=2008672 RepID=A0A2M9R6Q0_9FLAO|nr:KUP/HAK/KT family potassium transporter [Avrilella dinanensis]PJR04551.1 potassium transporter Kup [Avrilella dinanensis]